ncbi:biotin--[acetyl-CoA-carboxylase] ligase [Companilactobacillus nuruki]|uniref:Biotin--[acetyl-CoA-carboxylase] ligase n=1 Tax=Companilactobacillus nuruki TaxID=1993540 RepID=A0A2N7AWB8_9LACO|nr:biotin--[acetyl-CoA-carboxylase] ligase [Companilactobacillus nuruki]PMD73039.1 biotin--[acetyl-CoA-carboxylase] ligase [Companilactobacillus nuruki]
MNSTKQLIIKYLLSHCDEWVSEKDLFFETHLDYEEIFQIINNLKENEGYKIIVRKDRYYKFLNNYSLKTDIINFYSQYKFSNNLLVFKKVDSTQKLAKRISQKNTLKEPSIIVTDEQTKGYGRHGRHFYSPSVTGLYFSIIFPNWSNNLSKNELLTIDIAVIVIKVLERFFPDEDFKLKWVNDIYLKNFKVAGIITDIFSKTDGSNNLIVGIGINLTTKKFPKYLVHKATGINGQININRNKLLAQILQEIIDHHRSPKHFLNDYRKRSMILGKKITIQLGNSVMKCTAQRIEENGYLTVKDRFGNLKTYSAGEIVRIKW